MSCTKGPRITPSSFPRIHQVDKVESPFKLCSEWEDMVDWVQPISFDAYEAMFKTIEKADCKDSLQLQIVDGISK